MIHRRVWCLLLIALMLAGCSTKAEIMSADGTIAFKGKVKKVTFDTVDERGVTVVNPIYRNLVCRGQLVTTTAATGEDCQGMKGEDNMLECTSGETFRFNWEAVSCSSGVGMGKFSDIDDIFSFSYGFASISEAMMAVKTKYGSGSSGVPTAVAPKDQKGLKRAGSGSGFFISNDGYLITNWHVVKGAKALTLYDNVKRKVYDAELVVVDKANDLALLKADLKTNGLPLSTQELRRGQDIMALGYPKPDIQGREQKATFGRINSLKGYQDEVNNFQMDVPIQVGNSGGPVLDMYGETVGVVVAVLTGKTLRDVPQSVSYAVKIDYVHALLRQQKGVKTVASPTRKIKAANMEELVIRCEESVIQVINWQ